MPQRDNVREMELESSHISISFFFFFWPPHHLMCCCSPWATRGPAAKLFTRLTSSFPFEGNRLWPSSAHAWYRFPSCCSPLSVSAALSPSRHNDLCHSRLWCRVTRLHFESQLVLLGLSDLWRNWSWLGGRKGQTPFSQLTSRVCLPNRADCFIVLE